MLDPSSQVVAACSAHAARALTPNMIHRRVVTHVTRDFRLDPLTLESATRGPPAAAFARQVAMYLMHVTFALNFAAIGRLFGRDRTTVAHACRLVEDRRDDIRIDCRIAALETVCRAAVSGDGQ